MRSFKSIRLCLLSDTHGLHREIEVPRCELIIHAGNAAMMGNAAHLRDFDSWLGELNVSAIIVPGNHDGPLIENPGLVSHAHVLMNRGVMIEGLYIWGVAWSWSPEQRRRHYELIPSGVDVLVTHVPPYGVLDSEGGDPMLRVAMRRVHSRVVVVGHIHSGRGIAEVDEATCINASMLGPDGALCVNPFMVRIGNDAAYLRARAA